MAQPITMHVIPHTHWDREWHLSFQEFRIRLVDLVDHLLEILDTDPDFRAFHLDGQTIVLKDYLEIRPENEEKLRRYVREGRILIGPWYLQNDEGLVSGESTIRNLLIGHRICEEWGAIMRVGYVPDQFGHISQMPQILTGFGIDNAIYGRGRPLQGDRKTEFLWESPDGSRVLACLMAFWYNNAQRFPESPQDALAYAERARDQLLPHVAVPHLLLMNGVDHLEAQENLSAILPRIQELLPEGQRIIQSTLPDYIEAVRATAPPPDVHIGEMREDQHGAILQGTLSARMYLKQANERCQTLLERWVEPASAAAWLLGAVYPKGYLDYTWKLLIENHPHDSICGCSMDKTHLDMEPRSKQVLEIGEEHLTRALAHIESRIDTSSLPDGALGLTVLNPLASMRTDYLEVTVDFPAEQNVRAIRLMDDAGREVPIHLHESMRTVKRVLSPIELPRAVEVMRFAFSFVARDLPPCGSVTYSVEPVGLIKRAHGGVSTWQEVMENEFLTVLVKPNGSLVASLKDDPDIIYDGLNLFADGGDVGDEYRYVAPVADRVITSLGWSPTISILDAGPEIARIEVAGELEIPESSDPRGRSPRTVACSIRSTITLAADVPRIDIKTTIENRATDHRLRVLFPTGIITDVAHAETPFDVVERTIAIPDEWGDASHTALQASFVDVTDGDCGIAVLNQGLPEYQVLEDHSAAIALTLIRAVGRLSGGMETPGISLTPGGQMLGEWTFRYSVFLHAGDYREGRVWQQAHGFCAGLRAVQGGRHSGDISRRHSMLSLEPDALVLSAIKKAENAETLIVRCYNITDETVTGRLIPGFCVRSARLADLLERGGEALDVAPDGSVALCVEPHKIITVELEPE